MKRAAVGVEYVFSSVLSVFAIATTLLLYRYFSNAPWNATGVIRGCNYNLASYCLAVCLVLGPALVVRIACGSAIRRRRWLVLGESSAKPVLLLNSLVCLLLFAGGVYYFYRTYRYENDMVASYAPLFLRWKVHKLGYFAWLLAFSIYIFSFQDSLFRGATFFRRTTGAMFAFANALLLYAPNFLEDLGGGIWHTHAYVNSIINTAGLLPFDGYNISIYGHYALFYVPLVKLFGSSYAAIAIAICLFGFIAYSAVFYVLSKLVRSNTVFVLGCFAISGLQTILWAKGQYWQANPHRLLFPFLALAYVAWSGPSAGKGRAKAALKWLLGVCSLVWNLETGLFVLVVLAAHHVFSACASGESCKKIVAEIGKMLAFSVVCLVCAVLAVNIYNSVRGGAWMGLKRFAYPIGDVEYNVDSLRLGLPNVYHVYVAQIMISLLTLVHGLFARRGSLAPDKGGLCVAGTSVAVSGLCSLVYFMNRTAYSNISVSYGQFILLLALWGDKALPTLKAAFRKKGEFLKRISVGLPIGCLSFFGLTALAFESALAFNGALCLRADSVWRMDSLRGLEQFARENVPENTFAYGVGIPELYFNLGWDTQLHIIDASDIDRNSRNLALLAERRKAQGMVFTCDPQNSEEWAMKSQYGKYKLYVRKGPEADSGNDAQGR